MNDIVEEPDPLVLQAHLSDEFRKSARQVVEALGVDDAWIASVRDPFILVIDEEGLWLCPADAAESPYVSVGWPIVGRLRDSWGSRGTGAELVTGVLVAVVTLGGLVVGGPLDGPVLCVPIDYASGRIELRIPVDGEHGIASAAEKRRPRPQRGPMLQWVPD